METLEGNKLIAIFMGYTFYPTEYLNDIQGVLRKEGRLPINVETGHPVSSKYHTSWDELMPVVEKIDNLTHNGFPITTNIAGDGAVIRINETNAFGQKYNGKKEIANTLNANYFNDFPGAGKVSKIEATWQPVVAFIIWYNTTLNK